MGFPAAKIVILSQMKVVKKRQKVVEKSHRGLNSTKNIQKKAA